MWPQDDRIVGFWNWQKPKGSPRPAFVSQMRHLGPGEGRAFAQGHTASCGRREGPHPHIFFRVPPDELPALWPGAAVLEEIAFLRLPQTCPVFPCTLPHHLLQQLLLWDHLPQIAIPPVCSAFSGAGLWGTRRTRRGLPQPSRTVAFPLLCPDGVLISPPPPTERDQQLLHQV